MPEADRSIERHQDSRQIGSSKFVFADHAEDSSPVRPSLCAVLSSLHDPAVPPKWTGLKVAGAGSAETAVPMSDDLLSAEARMLVLILFVHRRVLYNNGENVAGKQ